MDFLHDTQMLKDAAGWLAILSILTFSLSLLIIPWIIGRLSADCFARYYDNAQESLEFSTASITLLIVRNIVGGILLLAGTAMLFLPGQGILTIIIAIVFLSFPGKRKLLLKIIGRPAVQRSLNWLREKRSKPPFIWPGPRH